MPFRLRQRARLLIWLLGFLLVLPLFAHAATTNVNVGQGGTNFVPSSVSIPLGDTVSFTWVGNNHSATSGNPSTGADGKFDSGIHNTGFVFSYTPTAVGSYPYYCRVHGIMMTGSITVTAATTPTPTATATATATATPTAAATA